MTTPHRHAALIKAWADGATIQGRERRIGSSRTWHDIDNPHWIDYLEYRIKPANLVRFIPVSTAGSKLVVGWGVTSKECAASYVGGCEELKGILRIEINPDTLELVSATMEKP